MTGRGIVVGVDGSRGSDAALAWAAEEARRRGGDLLIAHVGDLPDSSGLSVATAQAVAADLGRHARGLLGRAVRAVASRQPMVAVDATHRTGGAARVLVELSRDAELLVVGRSGMTDGFDALLGAVSHGVAAYARCSVTVVPQSVKPTPAGHEPTVVVGVSRSDAAMDALEAAFRHAQRCGARVLAVHAWGKLDWAQSMSTYTPDSVERWRLASQHLLDQCVHQLAKRYPQVQVDARLVRDTFTAALTDAARDADLLLIGGRQGGDQRMSRLGGTATSLIAQSPCAVEVVGSPTTPPVHGEPAGRCPEFGTPGVSRPRPAASSFSDLASVQPVTLPTRRRQEISRH